MFGHYCKDFGLVNIVCNFVLFKWKWFEFSTFAMDDLHTQVLSSDI
jgi:hypothetical protein